MIADKITNSNKLKPKSQPVEEISDFTERFMSPEKRQKIIDERKRVVHRQSNLMSNTFDYPNV